MAARPRRASRAASSRLCQPYPYDPDKAKALLKTAGFPTASASTSRRPNGRYLQDKQVAEAIVGQLEKVGIKAELETVEWSTYVPGHRRPQVRAVPAQPGRPADRPGRPDQLEQQDQGHRLAGLHQPGGRRADRQGRPDVDAAAAPRRLRADDEAVWDDSPWIYLYHQQDIYGVASRVKNFRRLRGQRAPGRTTVS